MTLLDAPTRGAKSHTQQAAGVSGIFHELNPSTARTNLQFGQYMPFSVTCIRPHSVFLQPVRGVPLVRNRSGFRRRLKSTMLSHSWSKGHSRPKVFQDT